MIEFSASGVSNGKLHVDPRRMSVRSTTCDSSAMRHQTPGLCPDVSHQQRPAPRPAGWWAASVFTSADDTSGLCALPRPPSRAPDDMRHRPDALPAVALQALHPQLVPS
eukprot:CAMPEP_0206012914 /NCGR_PEP_ID=MMETSP1464-20131121/15619_1 /ASSEMBLY_ACC=CAM_ASM_001124 /TAXON_ID=119497 /ORGANISM="Exanthemachrysis gayraliae, Strain RCC1523" /LENGTH=108 /DNA_ID=CAMNT_0053386617 /DNA_START=218 /DNA_END=544 /DNA_ORIENTATION=-